MRACFFRNAINLGLPVVTCPEGINSITDGDVIEIDLDAGCVKLSDRTFPTRPLPPFLCEIVRAGGLVP